MKKLINKVHGEGYLYDSKIEMKEVKQGDNKGQKYLAGKISLATDEDCLNIVDFNYIYVVPTFKKSGKTNQSYGVIEGIMNNPEKSLVGGATKETATKLKIDSAIRLNDYYITENNEEKLMSFARNEGGFINVIAKLNDKEEKRNTFRTDILMTNFSRKEDNDGVEVGYLKGAIFNDFSGDILPTMFVVRNTAAMDYFEGLELSSSNPVFTEIWGNIVAKEIIKRNETESAFGEKLVDEVKSIKKEYLVTGAKAETYDWDSDDTILASEVTKAMQDRETYLAEIKQRKLDYEASKKAETAAPASLPDGAFKF